MSRPAAHTKADLRRALTQRELRLHVQPKVDLRTGDVVGVEALVRWQHPTLGLLLPDAFLHDASARGMMVAFGDWVLAEAIELAARWRTANRGRPMCVWVNLATEQLVEGVDLCGRIRRALAAGTITPPCLGFEVTESTLLEDLPIAVDVLTTLRQLGFEIALDDFGTGYSSLWYLRKLPVTAVKIDRSFVAGIGGSLADEAIVAAVIDLAHALGLRVVAEGIEEVHQADALIRMGAERAQGYYFARPAEPCVIEPLLALAWCGASAPGGSRLVRDTRADSLPGFGSPRARLLLTALDTAHDSIIVTSASAAPAEGTALGNPIVYVNAAFEAETGYAASDVLGATVDVLLPESDRPAIMEWLCEVTSSATAASAEWPHRRADGSTYLCEVTLSPVFDERGVQTHWLHVRRDLTQRRAAEAADRRRLELTGFAADLATRVLGLGRDETLDDLDHVLAALGELLAADLVYFDMIDCAGGIVVPQASWTSAECADVDIAPAVIEMSRLRAWVAHLQQTTAISEWRLSDEPTAWMVELQEVFVGDWLDSHLYAPLHVGGQLIGVLGVARDVVGRRWSVDEMGAVQQIADAFANLLGRRRANDALRTSEARLAAMLASIGDLLVVIDPRGTIRYVNSRAEEVIGYTSAELVERHFLEFVHLDDHELAIGRFEAGLSGREAPQVTELRVLHRDGTALWFDVDMSRGEDSLVGGYTISLRNVSLQRANQESAQRRAALETVVLGLSQWALEVESEDIIDGLHHHLGELARAVDADSAFAALLDGDRVRNFAGWKRPGSPRLSFSFPADRAVPAIVARYRTLEPLIVTDIDDHDDAWAHEWRSFPVPDRSGLNVPLVSAGKCLGNLGVAMARTPRTWTAEEIGLVKKVAESVAIIVARHSAEAALRTSEARLASLLDSSQDLIIVVDDCGLITYANLAVERTLGYRCEDVVGTSVTMFVHSADRELAATNMASLAADEPTPATTLRVIRKDGSVGWWEVTAGSVVESVADGLVLTCREVTERRASEIAASARVTHVRYAFDLAQSALDLGACDFLLSLPKVCREMVAMLGADMVYVDRLDVSTGELVNLASAATALARPSIAVGECVPVAAIPEYIEMLRNPEPLVECDLLASPQPWVVEKRRHLSGERSLMAVGMTAAGELFGVLGVSMAAETRVWSEDEVTFLRIVGETIAHVLERARLDAALRASEARFRLLSETAADVVVLVDARGIITYVSPSSSTLLGLTPDELIGRSGASMIHPDFGGEHIPFLSQPPGTRSFTWETQLLRADGTPVWVVSSTSVVYDPDGRPVEFRSSLRDITDRKLLEMKLVQQALHDPLTGLANRELLKRSLVAATTAESTDQLAVLLLDLDGFKEVNDTFGHAVGDAVLQTIADRLRELTRTADTLARTGGDEFVLLCPGVDELAAIRVAERIVRAVRAPVLAGEVFVDLGASVGVAHGTGLAADPDRLLLDADRAMYAAKRAGRGCVRTAQQAALGA